MKRVYLNANVFIAFVKSEIGKPYRLFYQEVEGLLKRAPERFEFVLSDLALREIEKHSYYTPSQTIELFNQKEIRAIFVQPTPADFLLGKEFLKKRYPLARCFACHHCNWLFMRDFIDIQQKGLFSSTKQDSHKQTKRANLTTSLFPSRTHPLF